MVTPNNATPRTLRQVVLRWSLVVGLAATPSFLWGSLLTADQWPAMLSGVLIFIAAYTWGDLRTAATSWRQSPSVCWTLRTVFGLRIAMTLVFPLGAYVDMFTGAVTLELIGAVYGEIVGTDNWSFALTLLATLVQGVLLNLMLLMLGLLLLPAIHLSRSVERESPSRRGDGEQRLRSVGLRPPKCEYDAALHLARLVG